VKLEQDRSSLVSATLAGHETGTVRSGDWAGEVGQGADDRRPLRGLSPAQGNRENQDTTHDDADRREYTEKTDVLDHDLLLASRNWGWTRGKQFNPEPNAEVAAGERKVNSGALVAGLTPIGLGALTRCRCPARGRPTGTAGTPFRSWWRADGGTATSEMTVITPLLVMLMLFIAVVIHRGVNARLRLDDLAHQAARAASLERTAPAAAAQARETVTSALAGAGVSCESVTVATNIDAFRPGGSVGVSVHCVTDLGDALLLGVPGSKTLTATAREPIDTWRGQR
jgi:hypothetical protein